MRRFRWPSRFAADAARETTRLASPARRTVRRTLSPRTEGRGPSMYEMEGPRLAHAALVAGCPAAVRHEAATGRVPRRRVTGLPGLAASWSLLRNEHVLSGEAVLPPRLAGTQGLWPGPAEKLQSSTGHLPFIPCPSPLSTGSSTSPSTAAQFTGAPEPQQRPRRSTPVILAGHRRPATRPSGRTIWNGHRQGHSPGGRPEPGPGAAPRGRPAGGLLVHVPQHRAQEQRIRPQKLRQHRHWLEQLKLEEPRLVLGLQRAEVLRGPVAGLGLQPGHVRRLLTPARRPAALC